MGSFVIFARMKNQAYPTYKQTFALLFIWILCTLLAVMVSMPFFNLEGAIGLSVIYTLSMILTVAAGLAIRENWKLQTASFPLPIILISILAILAVQIIIEPLQRLVPPSDFVLKLFKDLQSQPFAFFFLVVIAAPILEELLFREIILNGYLKNYKPLNAILVSSFLFGLIHGNLAQGIGAFALGVLFGWIYWKTNSIIPCIILHAANNLVAFVGVINSTEEDMNETMRTWMDNDLSYALLYVLCIILAASSIWFLYYRYFSKNSISAVDPTAPLLDGSDLNPIGGTSPNK